jgi:antitoxin (DNA-binding transcriptional repressor) of toxin-antitoxin stability system
MRGCARTFLFYPRELRVVCLERFEPGLPACPLTIDLVHFLAHNIAVKRVNIHDAKTNLSRYLTELTPAEPLLLCNRNQPVAELRLLPKEEVRRPRIGVAKGQFVVPESFFEPLPDEVLKAFSGK